MHDFKLYKHSVEQLTQQLTGAKHRQLVLITGHSSWCYELLSTLTSSYSVKVLSKSSELINASWPEHTHQLLGQEFRMLFTMVLVVFTLISLRRSPVQ
ncbi:hypothetical protein ACOBV9_00775 [Pseudoalteromonas espejiana]